MKQKDLLFLSVWTFIVVAAWIGFSLYHAWVTSTITPELQIAIQPIAGSFDTTTINQLRTRKRVAPLYELTGSGTKTTPTPTPALVPFTNQAVTPLPTEAETTVTPSIAIPNIQGQ